MAIRESTTNGGTMEDPIIQQLFTRLQTLEAGQAATVTALAEFRRALADYATLRENDRRLLESIDRVAHTHGQKITDLALEVGATKDLVSHVVDQNDRQYDQLTEIVPQLNKSIALITASTPQIVLRRVQSAERRMAAALLFILALLAVHSFQVAELGNILAALGMR